MINYRYANLTDVKKLSILLKQVYIQTYGLDGVSDEFANFITVKFSEDTLQKNIIEFPESYIVADNDSNLVGAAEIIFDASSPIGNINAPELSKLYILEWFCGKGIGLELIRATEDTLRRKGYHEYWLWVLISNERAISFYKKNGFNSMGTALFQMEKNTYNNFVMYKLIP